MRRVTVFVAGRVGVGGNLVLECSSKAAVSNQIFTLARCSFAATGPSYPVVKQWVESIGKWHLPAMLQNIDGAMKEVTDLMIKKIKGSANPWRHNGNKKADPFRTLMDMAAQMDAKLDYGLGTVPPRYSDPQLGLSHLWDDVFEVFDSAAARGDLGLEAFFIRLPECFASACLCKTGEGLTLMPDYVNMPHNGRSNKAFKDMESDERLGRIVVPVSDDPEVNPKTLLNGQQLFENQARGIVVGESFNWITIANGTREFKFRAKNLKVVA